MLPLMGKIRILPDRIANQIAAGEVVERPVAVVKELVENALDAGATRIEVAFSKGGKSHILVRDNGHGMSSDDAHLAIERHATSKIRQAEDLNQIASFGFRGEALPSIASVSRFTLRTRPIESETGVEIHVNGGKHLRTREKAMNVGTAIEVAQLFNSVPARRKFLKTDKTEAAHIIQLCRLLAVAHPEVHFTLEENGRRIFQSPQCPSLKDRVREIFGKRLAEELFLLDKQDSGSGEVAYHGSLQLRGITLCPGTGRATRQDLHLFVNRRPVDSRLLNYAVIEAYHTFLPRNRYPACFLFIEIPPELIDVNVHPAKREIRFRQEALVRRFVMESLIEALHERVKNPKRGTDVQPPSPEQSCGLHSPGSTGDSKGYESGPAEPVDEGRNREAKNKAAALLARQKIPLHKNVTRQPSESGFQQPSSVTNRDSKTPESEDKVQRLRSGWHYLGQAHGRYGIFQTRSGIVLLNLAAARARILFESFLEAALQGRIPRQSLLFPITFEMDPLNADTLESHLHFFDENGFGVEAFGGPTFRLISLPEWFAMEEGENFIRDMTERIRERGLRPEAGKAAREELARQASLRAGKGESQPSEASMQVLVNQLLGCRNPLNGPDGKPTYFELSRAELDRRLGA